MASVSQGTTVTWAGVNLGEVVSVSVDGVQADSVEVTPRNQTSRVKAYSVADIDFGTVSITCRGTTAMTTANVGLTGTLSIAGPSLSLSFSKAIFERLGWSASVGDFQVFSVTFKMGS